MCQGWGVKSEGGSLVLIFFCFFRLMCKFCSVLACRGHLCCPYPSAAVAEGPGSRVSAVQGGCICTHWWQSPGLPWCLLARIRPKRYLRD